MPGEAQNIQADLLKESHATTRAKVEGVDPEIQVYENPDWRIRDVLGHIATWDREVTKSLQAYRVGEEYAISDLEYDDYNERAVLEQKKLTIQQLLMEWEEAREGFIEAVQNVPQDKFDGDLLYPWEDERGSIHQLVAYMVEHDEEHREEIMSAIKASQVD